MDRYGSRTEKATSHGTIMVTSKFGLPPIASGVDARDRDRLFPESPYAKAHAVDRQAARACGKVNSPAGPESALRHMDQAAAHAPRR